MNTVPRPTIVKVVQTDEIEYVDIGVNAAVCDIWDAKKKLAEEGTHACMLTCINTAL